MRGYADGEIYRSDRIASLTPSMILNMVLFDVLFQHVSTIFNCCIHIFYIDYTIFVCLFLFVFLFISGETLAPHVAFRHRGFATVSRIPRLLKHQRLGKIAGDVGRWLVLAMVCSP